jgi:hypothetical protein
MEKYLIILILSVFIFSSCQSDEREEGQIIELPVTYSQGFGPFANSYGFLVPEHKKSNPDAYPWFNTYPEITGIPKDWKGVIKSMVWLDAYQFVYQNFYQGNIDSSFIAHLKKAGNGNLTQPNFPRSPSAATFTLLGEKIKVERWQS